jgi:hypothetical protein
VRTTVTLDPDTQAAIERLMHDRGLTFKEAVNEAIRAGTGPTGRRRVARTRPFEMGRPMVSLDRALALAAAMEDEELLRRSAEGR